MQELKDFSQLTIDFILQHVDQQTLWERYFGLFDLNKKYINPLRDDNNPDCTFDYGESGDLLFADWAKKKHYTIWEYVGLKYTLDFPETLKKIAEDFRIKSISSSSDLFLLNIKPVEVEKKTLKKINRLLDISFNPIKPTKEHFDYWSTIDYQFTNQDFLKYRVIPTNQYSLIFEKSKITFKPKTIAFCYLISDKEKQIYLPFASKQNKFRQILKSPIIGIEHLRKEPVIITKSNKDKIINLLGGLNVCNILAEGYLPSSEDLMKLINISSGRLYTLFDNDKTGKEASEKWKENYGTIPLFLPTKDSYLHYKQVGLNEHIKTIKEMIE